MYKLLITDIGSSLRTFVIRTCLIVFSAIQWLVTWGCSHGIEVQRSAYVPLTRTTGVMMKLPILYGALFNFLSINQRQNFVIRFSVVSYRICGRLNSQNPNILHVYQTHVYVFTFRVIIFEFISLFWHQLLIFRSKIFPPNFFSSIFNIYKLCSFIISNSFVHFHLFFVLFFHFRTDNIMTPSLLIFPYGYVIFLLGLTILHLCHFS